jgi:hypothetical protein
LEALYGFLVDPTETVFVLSGYSGCGKSTLVKTFLERLPGYLKTARLIDPQLPEYEVALTATTNKAAENLAAITGMDATTIHAFLGLLVQTDYKTGITTLTPRSHMMQEGYLLFVDEASFMDGDLLGHTFALTARCKIVLVGDPAQLTQVKAKGTPAFTSNFTGAALTQVVRQAEGNPIVDLATQFRHTVNSGNFFSFTPDGHHIQVLDRMAFKAKIVEEFTRPTWRYTDSKILAWTNKCVIGYNQFVRDQAHGSPHFAVGDYAVNNSYISSGRVSVKTDQMVQITGISRDGENAGVPGNRVTLDHGATFFMPKTLEARAVRLKQARDADDLYLVAEIEQEWVDLRAAYAQTINKSQGSTYDRVFIDLDDVRRCNSGEQIARMLYVAVSRARHQVFLTGDLA